MDLLLLGAGMGVVGGMLPNPLQMIALTQVAMGRWGRAIFVLIVPPLLVDAILLIVTLLFSHFVPFGIIHYVAYAGGVLLIWFGGHALWELRRKPQEMVGSSAAYTTVGVVIATLAELASPGTWIYWITIAGPILAEGRVRGFGHVVPFFAGGLLGYYGAAIISTAILAWGVGLHKALKPKLLLVANILLIFMGISYLVRAYRG